MSNNGESGQNLPEVNNDAMNPYARGLSYEQMIKNQSEQGIDQQQSNQSQSSDDIIQNLLSSDGRELMDNINNDESDDNESDDNE